MVEQRRRRRPTRAGTVLGHDLIVATAIRLVDEHGAEGLSVRRLGVALGADPTALYRYFRNTDDLVRAVADELIGRALLDFTPHPDWRQALWDMGHRIYGACLARPRTAVLAAARVTGRAHEISAVEIGLGILRSAGFDPVDAAAGYHAFVDLTLGYAVLDAAAVAISGDDQAWTTTYAALPRTEYPNIAACVAPLAATMAGSAYPAALRFFLAGLDGRGRFGGPEIAL
ncbi:TetR/AcrR family transcriptional regulator [Micromonosporaceae bacterium Da 78-11]